jgi:drug/metabolite transporter (DMT)-like permease
MVSKTGRRRALAAVILGTLVGGGVPVMVKIGLKDIPPFSYTFLRFFIASIFILPVFFREKPKINKHLWSIILISLLSAANIILFSFGIRSTTATAGQILYTVVPILTIVLSHWLLRDFITKHKVIGIALGLSGALLLIFLPAIGQFSLLKGSLLGNLLIFLGVLSYSLYTTLSKSLSKKEFSPIYITTIFILVTVVVSFVFSIGEFLSNSAWLYHFSTTNFLSILYVAFCGTFLSYFLYQYAIKHGSPLIASLTLYLQPVSTFVWASLLLGERLSLGFLISALLIFTGAWITTKK